MIDAPAYSTHRGALHWLRPVLLILILAAFGLRLQELTRQDIWWDEARNIDVALRPFLQIATAPELDIQPPVYYLVAARLGRCLAWLSANQPSAGFLSRLLSVFAGVIGVACSTCWRQRAGGPAGRRYWRVLVGACSPFWLAESQEARMYTVGFALLLAAAIALPEGAFSRHRTAPPVQSVQGHCQPLFLRPFVLLSALRC